MQRKWISDDDRFRILSEVIRASSNGGVVKSEKYDEKGTRLLEEGVDERIFEKTGGYECPVCGFHYPEENIPENCEDCRADLEKYGVVERSSSYFTRAYPDEFKELLEPEEDDLHLVCDDISSIAEIKVERLHSIEGESHIHISPFLSVGSGFSAFPGYDDIFLDWRKVPDLLNSESDFVHDLQDFLDNGDRGIRDLKSAEVDEVYYSGPGVPGQEYTGKDAWYTLYDDYNKKEAKEICKNHFSYTYETMYESFSMEVLHTLFPYAEKLKLAGNNKPDGLIHFPFAGGQTFLVESKCSKNNYKISKEEDKACRYVSDFLDNVEQRGRDRYQLSGYLFMAHYFDDNSLKQDIQSFKNRVRHRRDLDVACISGEMMSQISKVCSKAYRTDPTIPYRIYTNTEDYRMTIDHLVKYTDQYQTESDPFLEEFAKGVINKGFKKLNIENDLDTAFKDEPSIESESDHIPQEYSIV